MRKIGILVIVLFMVTSSLFAQDIEVEKENIINVIQTAYIDGLHNKGNVLDIQKGFHPGFNLLGIKENMLTKFPIYSWLESFEKKKKEDPNPPSDDQKMICKYPLIDITGNSAMAKILLYRNKELIFTDYLQLYKFEEGWRIVSKIYFRH